LKIKISFNERRILGNSPIYALVVVCIVFSLFEYFRFTNKWYRAYCFLYGSCLCLSSGAAGFVVGNVLNSVWDELAHSKDNKFFSWGTLFGN
ncbi:hypothetical protein, partial [Enterococcus termitis]|uniref:hypothetical protein n=1 Tax=Enterococcus termitis TaxID=332950 RepID=UPI001B802DD7